MPTQTPQTDELMRASTGRSIGGLVDALEDHARTLERALTAAESRASRAEEELAVAKHSAARVEMLNQWLNGDDGASPLLDAVFNSHDAHSFWWPVDEAIAARGKASHD